MGILTYVIDLTNRIIIGAATGIGLIFSPAAGVPDSTPAVMIWDTAKHSQYVVTLAGNEHSSGSSLFRGGITGATLAMTSHPNCNSTDTDAGGNLICGTDAIGGISTGAILNAGNDRFVNVSGDTMTGALSINLTTGYVGLKVIQTGSGNIFHADQALTSSGLLMVGSRSKTGSGAATIVAANQQSGAYIYGSGGTNLVLDSFTAPGIRFGYRGNFDTNLYRSATTTLKTDGSLVVLSLANVGTFNGAGLTDCDAATQTLGWDTSTNLFTCGTDSDTTYTAGQGLTLTATSFSTNATLTGASVLFTTHSGSYIHAEKSLSSSGTLAVKGNITGSGTLAIEGSANIDDTSLVVLSSSNFVGVGTIPLYPFHVKKDQNASTQMVIENATNGTSARGVITVLSNASHYLQFGCTSDLYVNGQYCFVNSNNSPIVFSIAEIEGLRINTTNGFTGLGLNKGGGTTNAGSRLSVSGSVIIGNNIGSNAAKAQLDVKGTMSGAGVAITGMSATAVNNALCLKSDRTIGWCSSVVDVTGNCTCN